MTKNSTPKMAKVMGTTRAKAARPTRGPAGSASPRCRRPRRRCSRGRARPGRWAAQALALELLGDQGRTEQLVLQPVAEGFGEGGQRRPAAPAGSGAGRSPCRSGPAAGPHRWPPGGPGPSRAPGAVAVPGSEGSRPQSKAQRQPSGTHTFTARGRAVLRCRRARRRGGVWAGRFRPGHDTRRRGPFRRHHRPHSPGLPPTPRGLGRRTDDRLGIRPRRPRAGRGRRRRRPGRGHQRGQHEHLDGAHRPGDLHDPQCGGPHLRPTPGRDLPAAGHPHRGHRDLDHRPGAAAAAATARPRLVRPNRTLCWWTARCPSTGPGGAWPSSKSPAGRPGGGDPGRRTSPRRHAS